MADPRCVFGVMRLEERGSEETMCNPAEAVTSCPERSGAQGGDLSLGEAARYKLDLSKC